mgnify:CR=1 FL=1
MLHLFAWAAFLIFLGWAWQGAEIRPMDLFQDSDNMVKYAKEFFPPDFRDWEIYFKEMLTTLHIAVWGTVMAIICAVQSDTTKRGTATSGRWVRPATSIAKAQDPPTASRCAAVAVRRR